MQDGAGNQEKMVGAGTKRRRKGNKVEMQQISDTISPVMKDLKPDKVDVNVYSRNKEPAAPAGRGREIVEEEKTSQT